MQDHAAKFAQKCQFFGRWAVMGFMFFVIYMAGRFDFDFVWPALLLMLTTYSVFAGVLVAYAAIVDDVGERQLLRSACRDAINASLVMAVGVVLMAFYYLIVVVILGLQANKPSNREWNSLWSIVAFVPLFPMVRASNVMVNAVSKYAFHASRAE